MITPEAIANWKLQPAERATALLHDDAVFAANSAGTLEVFSAKQNKRLHELPTAQGTTPHLQWVDEQLLLTTDSGLWQAYQCKNSACELIFAKEFGKEIPFLPAIVKKQIYIQHPDELTAFGPFDNDDAISDMMIPLTKIAQENLSEKPGSIQLIPARVSLSQGYKQHFQALLFNEHGEFLKTIDPQELTWNWKGPGTFSKEQGKLTLPQNPIEVSKSTLEVHYESFTAESIIKVETSLKDFTVPSAP